jgi:hypothetical protein
MAQFSDIGRLFGAFSGSPLFVGKITGTIAQEKNNRTTAVPFGLKTGAAYAIVSSNAATAFLAMVSQAAAGVPGGSNSTQDTSANATNTTTATVAGFPLPQNQVWKLRLSGLEDLISVLFVAAGDVLVYELRDN